jgi:hypothetical protein
MGRMVAKFGGVGNAAMEIIIMRLNISRLACFSGFLEPRRAFHPQEDCKLVLYSGIRQNSDFLP